MARQAENSELTTPPGDAMTQEDSGDAPTPNEKNSVKKKKKKINRKGLSSKDNVSDRKKIADESKLWFREKRTWEDYVRRHRKDVRN